MALFILTALGGLEAWLIWLILAALFLLIEMSTVMLLTIWFTGGALAAMIVALLGGGIAWQIVTFLLVSAIFLSIGWRFRKKLNVGRFNKTATNADRLIGKIAIVTIPINVDLGQGQVKVEGMVWSAATRHGEEIAVGERVRVLAISGVKLIVEAAALSAPEAPGSQGGL